MQRDVTYERFIRYVGSFESSTSDAYLLRANTLTINFLTALTIFTHKYFTYCQHLAEKIF